MEDNEDGKSHRIPELLPFDSETVKGTASVDPVVSNNHPASDSVYMAASDASEVAAALKDVASRVKEVATSVEAATSRPVNDDTLAADSVPSDLTPSCFSMNDDYEAYIRGMPLEDWLKWKAESGYTYDLLSL